MGKIFVPTAYDADSALSINNEGAVAYKYYQDYEHDRDDIYTGRQNIFWKLVFDNFKPELKTMYQTLRADGSFNVENDLQRFKNHVKTWGERCYNHDAQEKYLEEFYEFGSKTYFSMLNGDKLCQTEDFLRNRYNYFDEKYVAGKAPQETIVMRGYAKANIPVKMFSNGYINIRWGNTYTQEHTVGGEMITMECPLTQVWDTETMIYMASEVTGIGDISAYQIGYLDTSKAPRLRSIKVGDESSSYENTHFETLSVGGNPLLETIDVSNCSALTGSTDLSNCNALKEFKAYGTALTSVEFPATNTIEVIKLPSTITGFALKGQHNANITFESDPTFSSLILEDCDINLEEYIGYCSSDARVRLIDFDFGTMTVSDFIDLLDSLSTFRGIDENGNTLDSCRTSVSGKVHFSTIASSEVAEIEQYGFEYITITADTSTAYVRYYTDNTYTTLLYTQTIVNGGNAVNPVTSGAISTPTKSSTAQYTYSFNGWNTLPTNVYTDKKVYALWTSTLRSYTITFKNSDDTVLETKTVNYGTVPTYTGSTPVDPSGDGKTFKGWTPAIVAVTGAITYYASYAPLIPLISVMVGLTAKTNRSVAQNDAFSLTINDLEDTEVVVYGDDAVKGKSVVFLYSCMYCFNDPNYSYDNTTKNFICETEDTDYLTVNYTKYCHFDSEIPPMFKNGGVGSGNLYLTISTVAFPNLMSSPITISGSDSVSLKQFDRVRNIYVPIYVANDVAPTYYTTYTEEILINYSNDVDFSSYYSYEGDIYTESDVTDKTNFVNATWHNIDTDYENSNTAKLIARIKSDY